MKRLKELGFKKIKTEPGFHMYELTPARLKVSRKCIECEDVGYFIGVISEGLSKNHPYSKSHVERCDNCKVFDNDKEAQAANDARIEKRTSLQARKRTSLTSK